MTCSHGLVISCLFTYSEDILSLALNLLFTLIVALNFNNCKFLSSFCLLETVIAYQTGKQDVKALQQLFRELFQ